MNAGFTIVVSAIAGNQCFDFAAVAVRETNLKLLLIFVELLFFKGILKAVLVFVGDQVNNGKAF